ncbi:MAG: hypothetical protein RJB66_1406 [Pseudomonadota bacterium]|jgi:hypothetical protein
MKSLLIAFVALASLSAQANEGNIELYHQEKPNTAVIQRPAIPNLTSPAPLATVDAGAITLQWSKIEDASHYALQVSTDPVFYSILVNEPIFKDTSYTFKDVKLEAGKKYYWRVAAVKAGNQLGSTKSLFNRSSFTVK